MSDYSFSRRRERLTRFERIWRARYRVRMIIAFIFHVSLISVCVFVVAVGITKLMG